MKIVKLTKGFETIIDDEDYNRIMAVGKWQYGVDGYAKHGTSRNKKTWKLHRFILNLNNSSIFVDHIDGNKLNNQKSNLRIATKSQNGLNRLAVKNSKSRIKGVSWSTRDKKWYAQFRYNFKKINLGYYKTLKEAALNYNIKALEICSEQDKPFLKLNDLDKIIEPEYDLNGNPIFKV